MTTLRIISLLFATQSFVYTCFGQDHIILRNGQESDVKLYQINDEKIIFGYLGDKTGARQEIPSKDVYMVFIEKQGNIYLTEDGRRITGEQERVNPKKNDAIYLVKGGEIGANNIRILENEIYFTKKKQGTGITGLLGKKDKEADARIDKSEVFMIRYKSGMVDVITPINIIKEVKEASTEKEEPEFVVVFYEVKRGDNLKKVAERFNVTTEKIIEWNDLSSRTKPTTPLTSGMQLMIYQPKQ